GPYRLPRNTRRLAADSRRARQAPILVPIRSVVARPANARPRLGFSGAASRSEPLRGGEYSQYDQVAAHIGRFPLLVIEVFLFSSASLGSCFANLQRINGVISDGTYDPRTQSTYWTRWAMGVISGVVLSQLIYDIFLFHHPPTDTAAEWVSASIGEPI